VDGAPIIVQARIRHFFNAIAKCNGLDVMSCAHLKAIPLARFMEAVKPEIESQRWHPNDHL
jgi:hypothetical protein